MKRNNNHDWVEMQVRVSRPKQKGPQASSPNEQELVHVGLKKSFLSPPVLENSPTLVVEKHTACAKEATHLEVQLEALFEITGTDYKESIFGEYNTFSLYLRTHSVWKAAIVLDNSRSHSYASVHGRYEAISLQAKSAADVCSVQVWWLKNNQKRQFSDLWIKNNCIHEKGASFCKNFTRTNKTDDIGWIAFYQFKSEPNITFESVQRALQEDTIDPTDHVVHSDGPVILPKNISWNEAAELCDSVGGCLPVFRSRDELHQVLNAIISSGDIPPVQALFAGSKSENGMGGFSLNFHKLTASGFAAELVLTNRSTTVIRKHFFLTLKLLETTLNQQCNQSAERCQCSVMTLENLAQPMWMRLPCKRPLIGDVVCLKHVTTSTAAEVQNFSAVFDTKCILKDRECHLFSWIAKNSFRHLADKMRHDPKTTINWHFLIGAIQGQFPPIFSFDLTEIITYKRAGDKHWSTKRSARGLDEALYIFLGKTTTHDSVRSIVLQCPNDTYVSYMSACDRCNDCFVNNPSDEVNCSFSCTNSKEPTIKCQFETVLSNGDSHETHYESFVMPTKQHMSRKQQGPKLRNFFNSIHCSYSSNKHFFVHEICSYVLGRKKLLVPCRHGEHLQSCVLFECNMKFKCPRSYCIPWNYACDGKWDCASGRDELSCGSQRICAKMLRCTSSSACIVLGNACDGLKNCPLGEDEMFCHAKELKCPNFCTCLLYSVHCFHQHTTTTGLSFKHTSHTVVLVYNCSMTFTTTILQASLTSKYVYAGNSNMTTFCQLGGDSNDNLPTIFMVPFNSIDKVKKLCVTSDKIKELGLSRNFISSVEALAFFNATQLSNLNLSHNKLEHFKKDMIVSCPKLAVLNLAFNPLSKSECDAFEDIVLHALLAPNTSLCCIVPTNTNCFTSKNTPLNNTMCKVTFGTVPLHVSWLSFAVVLIVNFTSFVSELVGHFHTKSKERKSTGLFQIVAAIDLSSLFFTIYILSLTLHSVNTCPSSEHSWQSSNTCFALCGFYLLFLTVPPTFVAFLFFVRFSIVLFPFWAKCSTYRFTLQFLVFVVSIAFCVTLVVIFCIKQLHQHIPNALCSPILQTDTHVPIIEGILWFTRVFLTIVSITVAILGSCVIKHKKDSDKRMEASTFHRQTNQWFHIQIISGVVSSIACYVSSIGIFLALHFAQMMGNTVAVWTILLIDPTNSVTLPAIFFVASQRAMCRFCSKGSNLSSSRTCEEFSCSRPNN